MRAQNAYFEDALKLAIELGLYAIAHGLGPRLQEVHLLLKRHALHLQRVVELGAQVRNIFLARLIVLVHVRVSRIERLQSGLVPPIEAKTPSALSHLDDEDAARLTLSYGLALEE